MKVKKRQTFFTKKNFKAYKKCQNDKNIKNLKDVYLESKLPKFRPVRAKAYEARAE